MAAVFDGSIIDSGSTFKVDLDTVDAVTGLKDLFAELKTLKIGAAGAQVALEAFFEALGKSTTAVNASNNIDDLVKTAKGLKDVLRSHGMFGGETRAAMAEAYKKLSGNTPNAKLADVLAPDRQVPGNGPAWIRGFVHMGRMIAYVQRLTLTMKNFADVTAKSGREIFLLAYNTQTAVAEIAKMGGAMEAYGGTKNEAANYQRGYETEMAKRRVGQSVGGKFVEASRLWGLKFVEDDWKGQEREIVKFLSDKNISKERKLGLQSTLGLSAAQVSRYSRGLAEFDRENERQAELHKNTEAAAEASDRYKRSLQHLAAAWEDMRSGALIPLMNLFGPLIEGLASISTWMRDNPFGKFLSYLLLFGGLLGKIVVPMARLIAVMKVASGVSALAGAAGAASRAGSVVSSVGSVASRAAMGLPGIIMGAVDTISNVSTAVMTGFQLKAIGDIRDNVTKMLAIMEAKKKEEDERAEIEGALLPPGEGGGRAPNAPSGGFIASVFYDLLDTTTNIMNDVNFMVNLQRRNGTSSSQSGFGITINQVDINVASAATNPVDVATAVREQMLHEMREVVVSLEPGGRA